MCEDGPMVPVGHANARASNSGDDPGNLATQLNNLAELGPRDEFIHRDVANGQAMPEDRRLSTCCV